MLLEMAPLSISLPLQEWLYLVPFSRYSTFKNIMTLKSRLEVTHPANLCTIYTSLNSADLELFFCY